jgi:plastocyanin
VNVVFAAPGYKSDTMVVSVDTGQLIFGSVPAGLGPNQTAQMYVALSFPNDSAVTVALGSTDPAVLSVPPSVVIPARATSVYFNVIAVATGPAAVTGSASIAKAGVSSTIVVGTPRLFISAGANAVVGQRFAFTVYAQDPTGSNRAVTVLLPITLSSSVPAHATFDSLTVTMPVGNNYVGAGVVFDSAGTDTITAAANGYASSSATITANGALVLIQPGANLASFVPPLVTIKAGQSVTWRNMDVITHTATADSNAWNTPIAAGTTATINFTTTGNFTYHCTIHPSMMGTVVVTP